MSHTGKRARSQADWNQRYIEDDLPWDSGEPDAHLLEVIEAHGVGPGRALEIGCGTGTNAIWLAARGFETTGLDLSPTAIAMAEKKATAAAASCQLVVADFLVDDVAHAPFDFVYDRGCMHVFDGDDERARFAGRVAALLAPDGLWHSLIGSTDGPPRDAGPPRRSAADIIAAVEPHFEILELSATSFDRDQHAAARAWVLVARRRPTHSS